MLTYDKYAAVLPPASSFKISIAKFIIEGGEEYILKFIFSL